MYNLGYIERINYYNNKYKNIKNNTYTLKFDNIKFILLILVINLILIY